VLARKFAWSTYTLDYGIAFATVAARRLEAAFLSSILFLRVFWLKEMQMTEARGMLEGLLDFSFRFWATPRMLKFLYGVHLLVGLVAGVVWVVLAFQQAPVQGLLALLGALVALFFWVLYCRVVLEVLSAIFRMAEAIAPDRTAGEQP
jgi:hypothetical protein